MREELRITHYASRITYYGECRTFFPMKSASCILIILLGLSISNASGEYEYPLGCSVDFVPNQGQLDGSIICYARSERSAVFCTEEGLIFEFKSRDIAVQRLHLKFSGARRVKPEVQGRLPGKVNYFIGNDPSLWLTDVPTFEQAVYRNLYPGADLIYKWDQRRLKYTFYLQPGSAPEQIQLIYEGIEDIRIDETTGELVIQTTWCQMRDAKPIAYQEIQGVRKAVDIAFCCLGRNSVGFTVGDYARNLALTIDPGFSTYLGGNESAFNPHNPADDTGQGITVDGSGNVYVTGGTNAIDFPTLNAHQSNFGGGMFDVFVAKFSSDGSLIYSTYLGGDGHDFGNSIVVDSSGNAYVTGVAGSNFPTTENAYDDDHNGSWDAFVSKLSSDGSLIYSTYLGGNDTENARDIAIDSSGQAYVTGYTRSDNFPVVNAYDSDINGSDDAFVAKLSSGGDTLIYSTYLGGSEPDYAYSIAVDKSVAYITGETHSWDFPTLNAYDSSFNGGLWDVFVAKIDTSQNGNASLTYSTYLGGSGNDHAYGIAFNSSLGVYVAGYTESSDFPIASAYDTSIGGPSDAFVTRLSTDGSALIYSTYLGGSSGDFAHGIVIDSLLKFGHFDL